MVGGVISGVEAGGLAERVGLRTGDELRTVNGQRVRDVIDVQFVSSEERLVLEVCREGQTFAVEAERRYGEPLGLDFVEPTFDGIRRCGNGCEFCFVSQMPPGLRRSVYVKDDDYRYSFLFGNYVTLTNLDEADWARIGEQHLSPLYVSVHATETDLRRRDPGIGRDELSLCLPDREAKVLLIELDHQIAFFDLVSLGDEHLLHLSGNLRDHRDLLVCQDVGGDLDPSVKGVLLDLVDADRHGPLIDDGCYLPVVLSLTSTGEHDRN